MAKKVLIIGGVAGGATAATRLRRLDEEAEIIMFERGEYVSYANCGLPYYIGGHIKERDKLLINTADDIANKYNIDIRVLSDVTTINSESKTITVKKSDGEVYEESYDYIILSPGAKPIKPGIPGIDSAKIFSLRTVPDTDRIKEYVDNNSPKSAVVIGGGFIGVEVAENLIERKLDVTLVEAVPHILAPFDSDTVVIAEKEMEQNGVKLILGDGVKSFGEQGNVIEITLNSGKKLTADMVLLSIGVSPDTGFLKDSGINLGPKGHIVVNNKMETNIKGIFAAGDAIEITDYVTKKVSAIPLAGPANKQGRIAADNICGIPTEYKGTQGTSILKIFDLVAGSTGANEKTLQRNNIEYKTVTIHPNSHGEYYPGALPITIKLIFNDEGKILGSQVLGYEGVDKRIDVIASVIGMNGTVTDLTELGLAYSPPNSSAKDPVSMAGYITESILKDIAEIVAVDELDKLDKSKTVLLDISTPTEYDTGHIDGAVNIPLEELRNRIDELNKEKEFITYCHVGQRGYIASRILRQKGFKVKSLSGGYKSYVQQSFKPGQSDFIVGKDADFQMEQVDKELDAKGLCCPGPLLRVKGAMDDMQTGQTLKVTATDLGFYEDIIAWSKRTDNELLNVNREGTNIVAYLRKGMSDRAQVALTSTAQVTAPNDNKTIIVFSGDLDKAIASFIIANGAASMGKKVTMFFTFWGLNVLRKPENVSVSKGFMDKMFGLMMPRGSQNLGLSRMNMAGMGAKMIRSVMKNKNISSLEELIKAAIDNGVEIVACQMSMDVMGLHKEELIDGIKIAGVGYYLGEAEDSNVNLFI
ncbi:MAG: FAD-dependent oxidoreductase [Clostridiales bacterium]|nr:FAD-dependent oxidoreductase [Clostridiales bacterium]